MAEQNKDKPSFDDRVAAFRNGVNQFKSDPEVLKKSRAAKDAVMDRVKAFVVCNLTLMAASFVMFNPGTMAIAGGIALAAGAVDVYKNGSNNFLYNGYKTVKSSWGLMAKDAVSLVTLPFKAIGFMLGIDGKKAGLTPAGQDAAPAQPQPEVQAAGQTFGQKLSGVFAGFAARGAAPANTNTPEQTVDITPAGRKPNAPKDPGIVR